MLKEKIEAIVSDISKVLPEDIDLLKEDIKQYGMWLEQIVYNAVGSRLIAAEDYYDAGVKYMEFARYKEAIEMFETAINMKPVFPDAINTLGVCYTKLEEYPKAIEFYEEALQQAGEHAGYMLNIAITQFMLGNKGLAKQKYDEVVMIDPMFEGKLDKVFGAAKASMAGPTDGPTLKISSDLEAELAEGSTKGLVEIKEAHKDVEPEDIKKVDFANFPNFSSICGTERPTLGDISSGTTQRINRNTTISTWNTALTAGDILQFEIVYAINIQRCVVSMKLAL